MKDSIERSGYTLAFKDGSNFFVLAYITRIVRWPYNDFLWVVFPERIAKHFIEFYGHQIIKSGITETNIKTACP